MKVIRLHAENKKRIAELVELRPILLQHRNSELEMVAMVFYGLSVGAGFVLTLGFMKEGWFDLVPALAIAVAGSLAIALRLSITEKRKPLKIRIQS